MDKFTTVSSVAAPLPLINIDTDMIMSKQCLSTRKRKIPNAAFRMKLLDGGSDAAKKNKG